MTALKKFPPENQSEMPELGEDMLVKLDESVSTLLAAINKIQIAAYVLCACFIAMTVAAVVLLVAVLVTNYSGSRSHRVSFQGLYHEEWCERLHGQKVQEINSTAGLSPCPDCIHGG